MKVIFFKNKLEFRKWLKENHEKEDEIYVGYYKIKTGKPCMTGDESVDEALCYGWIDGIGKSIDENNYSRRFTKRREGSIWSTINIKKVGRLTKLGLMKPAGLKIFNLRTEDKSNIYAHENPEIKLSEEYENILKLNKRAWEYFQMLAPSYKKLSTHWIMTAKHEVTRLKRLNEFISECEAGINRFKNNKYKK